MLETDSLLRSMAPTYMCNVRGLLVKEKRDQQEVNACCFEGMEIAFGPRILPLLLIPF